MAVVLRFAAITTLVLVLVACSGTPTENPNPESTQAPPAQEEPTQPPANDSANDGFVARVNGVGITEADYQRELERRRINSNVATDEALQAEVLETFIRQQLINHGAVTLGVTISDEDVQAEYDNLRSLSDSDAAWQEFLAQNNYTEEEMLTAQRDVLTTQQVQLTLLEEYFGEVEQVNARHIVVRSREEAESILARLSNGEGFDALAAELSIDTTTRQSGGDLGWFARNELFYKNLEDIAFQLQPGQMAGPVSTSLGYHVIQTMAKEVRPVEQSRLPMLSESVFGNWLDEQYRNSNIERYR